MIRVSCAVEKSKCSADLFRHIQQLGLKPIVTTSIVRVVYEGNDKVVADALKEIYEHEIDPEIYYNDNTKRR